MHPGFIKYYFIYLFSIYFCMRFLNLKSKSFIANIFIFILSSILSIITNLFASTLPSFSHLASFLLLWTLASIYTAYPQIAFIITTISFGISYCIHAFSSFISSAIIFTLSLDKANFSLLAVSLLTAPFHALISFALLKAKRFKNGLPLSRSINYINISTILCLFVVSLPTYFPTIVAPFWQKILFLVSTFFVLAFLIYWWQAQITKSYRRSLELRELESLRTEVVEKDILIQRLLKENDRLATITHRDNTLISTLTNSTCNYLMTDYANPAVAIEARDSLIANIKKLSDGRLTLPDGYNEKKARNFETGFSLMNDMLHNMDEDAIKMNITFSVHVGVMLKDFVPQDISEMDLVHLVDDLLKNAFKATKSSEPRVVQLQFYKVGKHFVVEVADSGIPFEVKSLVNMGIEKMTTYEDGSGIGLMDIWKTKENCRATYHIEEYDTPAPFTKKISLTFDGKNRYSIRTSRKDEILQMSKRADLQVYGYEE